MIKKIKSIANVGKFKSFKMSGGTETDFESFVPILGANAKGKSTLSAIFSSLKNNNINTILGRKTFGATTDQNITIEIVNKSNNVEKLIFSKNTWNKSFPKIEVFDNKFVSKNVYISENINEDHEKNVESVILGEEGIKLEEDFIKKDELCKKSTNRKKEITSEFSKHLGHYGLTFSQFRSLKYDKDIDEKIIAKEKEIQAQKNSDRIKDSLTKLEMVINSKKLSDFKSELTDTIKSSQSKIKDHIKNHISTDEENEDQAVNDFLSAGTKFLVKNESGKKHCSFCGQSLLADAESLILEYEKQFSKKYQSLVNSQKQAYQYFKNWNIDNNINRYVQELKSLGVEISFEKEIDVITNQANTFLIEIDKKSNLEYKINFSSLDKIITSLNDITTKVKEIKTKYSVGNTAEIISKLVSEKKKLELIKERGKKNWVDLCDEYQRLEDGWKKLTEDRDIASKNKIDYSKKILSDYELKVNEILEQLQADFRLTETKPKEGLRNRNPLFSIAFNGAHKIAINSQDESVPYFGNTLSESDKRLLAFAFFMACIQINGNLSDKVIILDDPVSSLDYDRKDRTVVFLNKFLIQHQPRQLVVLTHDRNFMALLNLRFNPPNCFIISHDPSNLSSEIKIMNPNDEFLEEFYRQILDLESLMTAKDSEITWERIRKIRDIVEQIFKRKYYLRLKNQISQNGSTSSFVKKLEEDDIYTKEKAKEIEALLLHFWNHDDSTNTIARSSMSPGDLKGIVKDFFSAVEII